MMKLMTERNLILVHKKKKKKKKSELIQNQVSKTMKLTMKL